jgi:indolepyruvate decarboxylase
MHYGVRHVFGIPGDYVLGFYDRLSSSPLEVIGTCKEDGAGFAADAYARVHGIGCCCVTYCVGGLSVANAIAGAYAEKSPVVVITGSPGLNERVQDPMLHHKVKGFDTQLTVFRQITEAAVVIDDPDTAFRTIDETLATCVRSKRPVYIELPRDMVDVIPRVRNRGNAPQPVCEPAVLEEALEEITRLLRAAERPVVLAGVEIHRHGMQPALLRLIEQAGFPVAATLLGKSVISEQHPNYLGVYEGAMGRQEVADRVEGSDCLLMLGTFMTDVNLGVFTAELDRSRCIRVAADAVQVRHHRYVGLRFEDVLARLAESDLGRRELDVTPPRLPALAAPATGPIRVQQLFTRLNSLLEDDMAVVCDVGLCLFGAIDLVIHQRTEFIAPAYYTSMGFGVPAAVGVAVGNPRLRPVVLVGDGAFQMTGQELSTAVRAGVAPIVIVLDNRGYTTDRVIREGPYNDIQPWAYEKMPELIGAGRGHRVTTEAGFVAAWEQAVADTSQFSLIAVSLEPDDHCPALVRLGERLRVPKD